MRNYCFLKSIFVSHCQGLSYSKFSVHSTVSQASVSGWTLEL